MAKLFDIVETETVKNRKTDEEFQVRLLKKEDNWGVDTTLRMEATFGYTEQGARGVYQNIIQSWTTEE